MRRLTLAIALTLATLALVAPAATHAATDATATRGVFAGRVQGTNAYIALLIRNGNITAYVCDSRTIARWLLTRTGQSTTTLAGPDGFRIRAHFAKKAATGTVTLEDGSRHRFRAPRTTGKHGLWWATGETTAGQHYWAGWILLPGGRQRGNTVSVMNPDLDFGAGGAPVMDPDHDFVVGRAPRLDPQAPAVTVLGIADTAKRLTNPFTDKIIF